MPYYIIRILPSGTAVSRTSSTSAKLEIFGGSIADELSAADEVKLLTTNADEIESAHLEVDVEERIRSKRCISSFLLPEEIRIIFLYDEVSKFRRLIAQ